MASLLAKEGVSDSDLKKWDLADVTKVLASTAVCTVAGSAISVSSAGACKLESSLIDVSCSDGELVRPVTRCESVMTCLALTVS